MNFNETCFSFDYSVLIKFNQKNAKLLRILIFMTRLTNRRH